MDERLTWDELWERYSGWVCFHDVVLDDRGLPAEGRVAAHADAPWHLRCPEAHVNGSGWLVQLRMAPRPPLIRTAERQEAMDDAEEIVLPLP